MELHESTIENLLLITSSNISSTMNTSFNNNNTTTNSEMDDYYTPFEFFLAILIGITYSITMIVGIIGNSLVLLTVLLQPQMRSTTNILILNLAIAELLFIIICVPFTGVNYVLR